MRSYPNLIRDLPTRGHFSSGGYTFVMMFSNSIIETMVYKAMNQRIPALHLIAFYLHAINWKSTSCLK